MSKKESDKLSSASPRRTPEQLRHIFNKHMERLGIPPIVEMPDIDINASFNELEKGMIQYLRGKQLDQLINKESNDNNVQYSSVLNNIIGTQVLIDIMGTYSTISELRSAISSTCRRTKSSFNTIIFFNWIIGIIGIALSGFFIYSLFVGNLSWQYLVTGGVGLGTLLVSFLIKPQKRLLQTGYDLNRLHISLFTLFQHYTNWGFHLHNIAGIKAPSTYPTDKLTSLIEQSGDDIFKKLEKLFKMYEDYLEDRESSELNTNPEGNEEKQDVQGEAGKAQK